jgi:transcriptional regulator with XRE-family HTH domain
MPPTPTTRRTAGDAAYLARLGQAVRFVRTVRGLSQHRLATRAGCARSLVASVERGEHGVTVISLRKLAAALQVPPANLLQAAESTPGPQPAPVLVATGQRPPGPVSRP